MVDDYVDGVVDEDAVDACVEDPNVSDDYVLAFLNVDAKVEESGWALQDDVR